MKKKKESAPKKHNCRDCDFCQWCSDRRCNLCLQDKKCKKNKKK